MSSESDDARRLQEILAALVGRRITESLTRVELAIAAWRRGEHDVLEAHAEALRHAARASRLSSRVAKAGLEGPNALLRDAFDAGLLSSDEFRRVTGKSVHDVPPPPPLDEAGDAAEAAGAMPAKQGVIETLLKDGPVLIHVDARRDDIDVPAAHRADAKLVLRLGYGLVPPIPDLGFDAAGVTATLTFRGVPHTCRIAWAAIYAVVAEDGRGLVWPESVPPEVAKDFAGDGDATAHDGEPEQPEPAPPAKPGRGHLKLV